MSPRSLSKMLLPPELTLLLHPEHADPGTLESIVFVVVLYACTIAAFPLFLAIVRTDAQLASSALLLRGTDKSVERQLKIAHGLRRIKMLPLEQRQRRRLTRPPTAMLNDGRAGTAVGISVDKQAASRDDTTRHLDSPIYVIGRSRDSLFKEKEDGHGLGHSSYGSEDVVNVLPLHRHPYASPAFDESAESLHAD